MNQIQKLLLCVTLLLVGITLLVGYSIVEEPDRCFNIRMAFLVLAEVILCAESLVISRSTRTATRMLPFTLGYPVIWLVYVFFTFQLVLFGGLFSMKWVMVVEAIGLAVAVAVRIVPEMGGQAMARQEVEDRQALAWRKLSTLQACETADAMLTAFPGDAEIRKAAENLRDGFRYAASSTPDTSPLETKIDDELTAVAQAVSDMKRDDILKLCTTIAADLKKRHRLALLR